MRNIVSNPGNPLEMIWTIWELELQNALRSVSNSSLIHFKKVLLIEKQCHLCIVSTDSKYCMNGKFYERLKYYQFIKDKNN